MLRFIDGTAYKGIQSLDNVNRTHLVLAGGKIVLQKNIAIVNVISIDSPSVAKKTIC